MPTFASFDGTHIHYEMRGDGRPVVLLHSFCFEGGLWERQGLVGALEADDVTTLVEPLRALRARVDRKGGDRFALAALMRAQYVDLAPDFDDVCASVLILTGERDRFGSPRPIADAIPNARAALVDADHEHTLDHPDFTPTVVAFLAGEEPDLANECSAS